MKFVYELAIFLCMGLAHCNTGKGNRGNDVIDEPSDAAGSRQSFLDAAGASQPHLDVAEQSQPLLDVAESSQPLLDVTEPSKPLLDVAEQSQPLLDVTEPSQPLLDVAEPSQAPAEEAGPSQAPAEEAGPSQTPVEEAGPSQQLIDEQEALKIWFQTNQIDSYMSELGSKGYPYDAFTSFAQNQRARLRKAIEDEKFDIIPAIIDEGVDLNAPFEDSKTALHVASSIQSPDAVKLLVARKVPLETRTEYGQTAFRLAAMFGNMDTATILLQAGADINAADKYQLTPLHGKIYEKLLKRVEWLLVYGASLYPKDSYGRNPLDNALIYKWDKIVWILIEYGADISPPKYDVKRIFEKHWKACFKESRSNLDDFDNYVMIMTHVFLAEQGKKEYFQAAVRPSEYEQFPVENDELSTYARNQVFALYRILKATYPKWNKKWKLSKLERAKAIFFNVITAKITEKNYLREAPFRMKYLVPSERMYWKIERLSFYLALRSIYSKYPNVKKAFTSDEIMHFIKNYIE